MTDISTAPAVLWLAPYDAAVISPITELLAEDHRVLTLAPSSTDVWAATVASFALDQFVLVGQSSGAAAALALARSAGEACAALIMIAPLFSLLQPVEAAPDIPLLLLLGTEDTCVPPSSAAALCAAWPRAHPILIYGAGHALDRERPEAVTAVLRDFIARRDKFIVRDATDLLYP